MTYDKTLINKNLMFRFFNLIIMLGVISTLENGLTLKKIYLVFVNQYSVLFNLTH
jgi:hypothetical protein